MGVITFKLKLSKLNQDRYLRFDVDYIEFNKTIRTRDRFLKDYVKNIETGKPISKEDYSENGEPTEFIHLVVRNIKNGELNLENPIFINEDKGEELKSFKIEKGDIVIAISANCGASFYFEDMITDYQLTLSHYLAKFKVNEDLINPRLLVYYLNSSTMRKYFKATETGKTQKNLSKTYLRELPILLPESIIEQNNLLVQIQSIETEIIKLKNLRQKPLDIINKVFGEEFNFDWKVFERLKKQKTYSSNLNEFANNIDCRMGLKFHNLAGKFLHSFLVSKTTKKIKDFIAVPIVLGKSVSPSDYDEDGEFFYIAMSNIKTYAFDPEDCKKVSDNYSSSNLKKTVQKGDILLARSGEGTIGKVALIEDEDLNAIFADFTQRIRLTNYNKLFAYYYFRSEFFQYLVYTHKKGLGNNTNIFPSQIQEFPIPDWDDVKQTETVEKIKTQIDKQNIFDSQIEFKQQEISKIIADAIQDA
jgi:type I restriction enzyme, S subunit